MPGLASALAPAYSEPPAGPTSRGFKTNPALDAMLVAKEPPPVEEPIITEEAKAREAELLATGKRAAGAVAQSRADLAGLQPPKLDPVPDAPVAKHTSPMEAFGSTASILAMIGSLATKRPLMHALNNAAGVIEAYKANDTQRANEEFARWKANTDNAFKLHDYENQNYQQALAKISTNARMAADEVQVLASSYGDPVMRDLARAKNYAEMQDYAGKRLKMFDELKVNAAELGAMQQREELVQEFINSPEYGTLDATQKAAKINAIRNPSKALGEGQGKTYNQGNYVTPDGRRGTGFDRADGSGWWVNPDTGETEIRPPGTLRASLSEGAPLSGDALLKRKLELNENQQGAKLLKKYFATMKDIPSGIDRWATDLSAHGKTLFGQPLNDAELKLGWSQAMVQRLLGLNRESVVGGGVMTEYDAQRVIAALGGDPASAFQNPQVLAAALKDMYEAKLERIAIFQEEVDRSDKFMRGRNAPAAQPAPTTTAPTSERAATTTAPVQGYTPPGAPAGDTATTPPAIPGALPLPPEFVPGSALRKKFDAAGGKELIQDEETKLWYTIKDNQLVPVEIPKGPAGGPLEGEPAPISRTQPLPAPTPAVKSAATTTVQPQNSASGMVSAPPNAQPARAPIPFGRTQPPPFIQSAEPMSPARAAIQSTRPADRSESLAASRRDADVPEGKESDIERMRRAAAGRFDKLLGGRKKEERGKSRRYKLSRDENGDTIVEVLN